MTAEGRAAAILGAGIAGISTARVLSGLGYRVVLIDRKFGPVAQADQLHVLLLRGQRLLRDLFPDIYNRVAEECPKVNWGAETYWRTPAGPMPSRNMEVSTYLFSRGYLDQLLLDSARGIPGCEFVRGEVTGMEFSDDSRSVRSVVLADKKISCDLCIDTLGRYSRSKKLLESKLGGRVPVEKKRTTLRYCTMHAREISPGKYIQAYYQIDGGKEKNGGVISPVEGGGAVATFITIDGNSEFPSNPFLDIPDETFQRFLETVNLGSEQKVFGNLHNIRHRYGKYRQLPENFFLIGDSVCQLNPVFGQGMTLALEGATLLGEHLKKFPNGDSRKFQLALERKSRFPWMIATMDPYNPGIRPGPLQWLTKRALFRVIRKSKKNSRLHRLLVDVLHMVENPLRLFLPQNLI